MKEFLTVIIPQKNFVIFTSTPPPREAQDQKRKGPRRPRRREAPHHAEGSVAASLRRARGAVLDVTKVRNSRSGTQALQNPCSSTQALGNPRSGTQVLQIPTLEYTGLAESALGRSCRTCVRALWPWRSALLPRVPAARRGNRGGTRSVKHFT